MFKEAHAHTHLNQEHKDDAEAQLLARTYGSLRKDALNIDIQHAGDLLLLSAEFASKTIRDRTAENLKKDGLEIQLVDTTTLKVAHGFTEEQLLEAAGNNDSIQKLILEIACEPLEEMVSGLHNEKDQSVNAFADAQPVIEREIDNIIAAAKKINKPRRVLEGFLRDVVIITPPRYQSDIKKILQLKIKNSGLV